MSNITSDQCMFIGLPGSGKSSFIGALWHVVESNEIISSYSISSQPEDREYLNMLRAAFLSCTPPERTKIEFPKTVELAFKNTETGQTTNFIFPDLSGETYSNQFSYRKLSEKYVDDLSLSNGIILFVNPHNLRKPNLITDADPMLAILGGQDNCEKQSVQKDIDNSADNLQQWKTEFSQTQVVLVDLLQMVQKQIKLPCRISIIISAWDLILNLREQNSDVNPKVWLKINLPLLAQYLEANSEDFIYNIFGVSAQGGNYIDEEKELMQEIIIPSERIKVQDENSINNDITLPIKWILNKV